MLEYSWWQYAIQPCIAGIVGWGTNVIGKFRHPIIIYHRLQSNMNICGLALQMTFYPIKYVGIDVVRPKNSPLGFIGWQGIIPGNSCLVLNTL